MSNPKRGKDVIGAQARLAGFSLWAENIGNLLVSGLDFGQDEYQN